MVRSLTFKSYRIEIGEQNDTPLGLSFVVVDPVCGNQHCVRRAQCRGMVEGIEQVVSKPDREVHGSFVCSRVFDGLPLDQSQVGEIFTCCPRLLTGEDGGNLREKMRWLPEPISIGIDTCEQCQGWLHVRLVFPLAQKPLEGDARVND